MRVIPHREPLQPNPRPCCNANCGALTASRDTLTLSSLEHDASVGLHAADHFINSPVGHVVMDVGGHIPGPIGTVFTGVSIADDVCVMRGCIACMLLLLCGSQHACRYHHRWAQAGLEAAEAAADM